MYKSFQATVPNQKHMAKSSQTSIVTNNIEILRLTMLSKTNWRDYRVSAQFAIAVAKHLVYEKSDYDYAT